MRVLFISGAAGPDYQCDSLYHGLRTLFGADVVDYRKLDYMYQGFDRNGLYGKGFSLYALLEDFPVDREDIQSKIKNKFYDYIVFGSIQREHSLLGEVRSYYPPSKIILIDGEDNPQVLKNCVDHGVYFKRELHSPQDKVFPIQFGFPAEKIQDLATKKELMAPLDPMDTRTYIYEDEQSYYDAYRSALFGITMKKAGYDCMRHYEIMACRAIPYFVNLEFVPATIMVELPRQELTVAKTMLEYNHGELFLSSAGTRLWETLETKIFSHFVKHLTTSALATRVLSTALKFA